MEKQPVKKQIETLKMKAKVMSVAVFLQLFISGAALTVDDGQTFVLSLLLAGFDVFMADYYAAKAKKLESTITKTSIDELGGKK